MGLLNRHLHGGGSASSSQRGRSKAAAQHSSQQQPLLLYEPVTSGQHWRSSSGQALLPPGRASSSSRDLGPSQPGQPDRQQQQQAQGLQRVGSPASSEGGDSSFYSGELPGSPDKRSPVGKRLVVLRRAGANDGRALGSRALGPSACLYQQLGTGTWSNV